MTACVRLATAEDAGGIQGIYAPIVRDTVISFEIDPPSYSTLLRILALQGFYNAQAGITLPNVASVGLHEVMGFQPIGVYRKIGYKLGAWHDVGWWQLVLRPHAPAPAPLTDVSALQGSAAWHTALTAGTLLLRL